MKTEKVFRTKKTQDVYLIILIGTKERRQWLNKWFLTTQYHATEEEEEARVVPKQG